MNGKIDKYGWVYIERSGIMKLQFCPFSNLDNGPHCGDWCPHFGEPVTEKKVTVIELCHNTTLYLTTFTDERKSHE